MKKLFLSLLLTLLSVATWALTFSSGQFKYTTITSSLAEITGYNSSVSSSGLKDLVIPRTVTYNGKTYTVTTVTGLGSSQFPESVSVEFSLGMITIGQDAFKGCSNLKTVKLPSNVYQISANAFFDCPKLTEFQVARPTALDGSAAIFNSAITVKIPYTADLAAHQASAIFSTSGVTVKQALGPCDFKSNGMMLARTETGAVPGNVKVVGRVATTSTTWNIPATATLTDIGTFTITGIAPYANAVEGSNLTTLSISGNLYEIGESAFRGNANLTNVSIVTGSVKTIAKDAFKNCSALTKLSLENAKVENIGATFVSGCSSLTQVELPSSLTTLSYTAFYGAANLKNITVNSNSTNFESYSGWLYNKGKTKLICCPPANTSNGWATTVKTIGSYAFSYTQRTSIRIPYGVTTISNYAFYYAPKVKDIYIPSSVTSLGTSKTFYYCSALQGFFINMKSMPTITSTTFEQSNYKNAYLYVHNGLAGTYKANTYWKQFKEIDRGAYDLLASSGGYNVTSSSTAEAVTLIDPSIPASVSDALGRSYTVTAVADSAALGSSDLMVGTLTGPNVTSVGKNAFYNCSQLTAVNLPKVKTLGVGAFSRCSTLQTVTLPTTMTAIGENCFQFCSALTSIRWPLGVKDILGAQFVSSGLTTFEAPYGVETIGEGCFQNCQQLTRIVLPSTVKSVGAWAFMQCSSLTDLIVNRTTPPTKTGSGSLFGETASSNNAYLRTPVAALNTYKNNSTWSGQFKSGHITPGGYDFATSDNYGLTVTALPSSSNGKVTAVYKYRTSVRPTIDMTGTETDAWGRTFNITALGDSLFAGTNVQTVKFPTSVTKIPNHCFDGCTQIVNLNNFTMPNVTAIGDQAFANCTNLQSVNLQNMTTLGQGVFLRCSKLQTVNMPTTMTAIGQDCFQFCSALTSIRWPLGVKDILGAQFVSSGLTTFEAPYGVETIGEGCFQDCQQLTRIVLPSTVKSVGAWAFMQCSSLTDLVVNRTTPPSKTGSGSLFGETASSNNAYLRTPVSAVNTYKNNSTWNGQFKSGHITPGGYDFATSDNYGLTVTALPSSSNGKVTAVYKYRTSVRPTIDMTGTETDAWGRTFNITALGDSLFAGTNVQTVKFPTSVTKIPNHCFDGCTQIVNLNNFTMPNVTAIGDQAFANCTNLKSVNLQNMTTLGQGVFLRCSKLQTVNMPTTMTAIGQDCFQFCSALTSIRWPLGVKDILGAQFVSSGLQTFEAPYGVETIGAGCFQDCQQLTRIVLPSTVKSVGAWAFMQCGNLIDLIVNSTTPPTKTGSGSLFGETASSNNAYLRTPLAAVSTYKNNSTWSGQFKNGHITAGGYDFLGTSNLALTVTIAPTNGSKGAAKAVYKAHTAGENTSDVDTRETFADAWSREFKVMELEDSCFAGTLAGHVTLSNNVTRLPNNCFDGSFTIVSFDDITMPGVTEIGDEAFANCQSFNPKTVPAQVTKLGSGVFKNCTAIDEMTLPNTVTSIGFYLFHGCTNMKSVTLSTSLISVPELTFNGCASLTEVNIPMGVYSMGAGVFAFCTNLKKVTIPSSVEVIRTTNWKGEDEWGMFFNCSNLEKVIMNIQTPKKLSARDSWLFGMPASATANDGPKTNAWLYVPNGCAQAYRESDYYNRFLDDHIVDGAYDIKLGDVNGDGNVTPADAIMILYRYFNVEQSGFIANMADLNKDGFISPADAIETLYMYFNSSGSRTPKASKAAEALLQEIIQTVEPE